MIFFEIIIFLFLIGLVARLVLRYLLPWLLKRFLNRQMKKYSNEQSQQTSGKSKKVGNIKIDFIPSSKNDPKSPKQDEEYVDYEEIN